MLKLILVAAAALAGSPVFASSPIPAWGTAKVVTFSRDARPVDGDLVEVILTKSGVDKYDVTRHVATAGFGGTVGETSDQVASGLKCQNGFADEIGTLTSVACV